MDEQLEIQLDGEDKKTDTSLEREAFDIILPHLVDILAEHNLGTDALIFETLKDNSSVYFLSSGCMVFHIRIRKVTWYVSIPETMRNLLPANAETSSTASEPNIIRVKLTSPQDILTYRDALQETLRDQISQYRSFGCCGRYVQCSDARRCVHPDPKEAIGCWYKTNLLAGRIFYGKNKNVP